jgi:CheY-like chemotaxis protein
MANLLIVDDNPGLREGISTYFESQGHRSYTASGVQEAVEQVKRYAPDLVLSDLMMDDGTGLNLRQEIKRLSLPNDPYFILITGHPTLDNARDAFKDGGIDLYLTKPFQMPALALAVENGLKKRPSAPSTLFKASEAFYHEFFLTLNPVLPRLLLMLEGRYGQLNEGQQGAVASVLDTWRSLVWLMADFYSRMHDPRGGEISLSRWHGPAALKRILARLDKDFIAAALEHEVLRDPRLPLARVHAATAEALIEAVVLRLAAFSAPGATLTFTWEKAGSRLALVLQSDRVHPSLTPELMRTVALLPPVMPLLEMAGVDVQVAENAGPWTLWFELGG